MKLSEIEIHPKSKSAIDSLAELHAVERKEWDEIHGNRRRNYQSDYGFYSIQYVIDYVNESCCEIMIIPAICSYDAIAKFIHRRMDRWRSTLSKMTEEVNEDLDIVYPISPGKNYQIISVVEVPRETLALIAKENPAITKLLREN